MIVQFYEHMSKYNQFIFDLGQDWVSFFSSL
jgi:hypothetical protein